MAFFSSAVSWAKVFRRDGTKKMGSYPNPPSPIGAKAMVPWQSPSAVRVSPLGKAQTMAVWKWAARFVAPRILPSSRRQRSGSLSSPPYRAEYTPGAP